MFIKLTHGIPFCIYIIGSITQLNNIDLQILRPRDLPSEHIFFFYILLIKRGLDIENSILHYKQQMTRFYRIFCFQSFYKKENITKNAYFVFYGLWKIMGNFNIMLTSFKTMFFVNSRISGSKQILKFEKNKTRSLNYI